MPVLSTDQVRSGRRAPASRGPVLRGPGRDQRVSSTPDALWVHEGLGALEVSGPDVIAPEVRSGRSLVPVDGSPAEGSQVSVADDNLRVATENLELIRQKLQAGVSDNVELVQAQEAVATAQLDVINSVLAHNVAKLAFAGALGEAASNWRAYLQIP